MELVPVLRNLVPLAIVFVICDLPWLYLTSSTAQTMIKKIQGGTPMILRFEGAIPVYLALAFLVQRARSTLEAFLIGLCTYAVYDFTNYSTLTNYDLKFAIADSIWGGVLFSIVRQVGTSQYVRLI